jgi:hypothetical protein
MARRTSAGRAGPVMARMLGSARHPGSPSTIWRAVTPWPVTRTTRRPGHPRVRSRRPPPRRRVRSRRPPPRRRVRSRRPPLAATDTDFDSTGCARRGRGSDESPLTTLEGTGATGCARTENAGGGTWKPVLGGVGGPATARRRVGSAGRLPSGLARLLLPGEPLATVSRLRGREARGGNVSLLTHTSLESMHNSHRFARFPCRPDLYSPPDRLRPVFSWSPVELDEL